MASKAGPVEAMARAVHLWIGELEHEGDIDAFDLHETRLQKKRLAGAGATEGNHGRLVLDLGGGGQREGSERPCSG